MVKTNLKNNCLVWYVTNYPRDLFDLVLSLKQENKKVENSIESHTPRLISTTGELSTTFDFNGHNVTDSCGVTYQNKQFLYGSAGSPRQILELKDCGLINVGFLEVDHKRGACGSTNGVIILCFANDGHNRCRQGSSINGPWSDMALSTYGHFETTIATSSGTSRHFKMS